RQGWRRRLQRQLLDDSFDPAVAGPAGDRGGYQATPRLATSASQRAREHRGPFSWFMVHPQRYLLAVCCSLASSSSSLTLVRSAALVVISWCSTARDSTSARVAPDCLPLNGLLSSV